MIPLSNVHVLEDLFKKLYGQALHDCLQGLMLCKSDSGEIFQNSCGFEEEMVKLSCAAGSQLLYVCIVRCVCVCL